MGDAVERLVALASTSVESYTRTSKTGKRVNVRTHMRAVDKMSTPDLVRELGDLGGKSDNQSANRKQQIIGEMRKRNVTPKAAAAAPADPLAAFESAHANTSQPKIPSHTIQDARAGLNNYGMQDKAKALNAAVDKYNQSGSPEDLKALKTLAQEASDLLHKRAGGSDAESAALLLDKVKKLESENGSQKPSAVAALKSKTYKTDDPNDQLRKDALDAQADGKKGAAAQLARKALEADDKRMAGEMAGKKKEENKNNILSQAKERLAAPITDPETIADLLGKDAEGTSAKPHMIKGKDGSYTFTPERQALHLEILEGILDGFDSQENPKFHVMGGGPAAGKSVMEGMNPEISEGHALLNSDDIKLKLPEYEEKGLAGAGFTHEESSYITKKTMAEGFHRRVNVTLDGTGNSSPDSMRGKISPARAAGYEVNAFYVNAETETAVERALARAQKTGRFVEPSIVRRTHVAVSATFPAISNEFDSVKLYDTQNANHDPKRGPLVDPILVGTKAKGENFKVLDAEAYRRFTAKATEKAK